MIRKNQLLQNPGPAELGCILLGIHLFIDGCLDREEKCLFRHCFRICSEMLNPNIICSCIFIMLSYNSEFSCHYIFIGWKTGECGWMVSFSPRLWMLAIWHRCFHSDAQSTIPRSILCTCNRSHENSFSWKS